MKKQLSVVEAVVRYREMEQVAPSLLREVKYQYADMASGGDGGSLGFEDAGETTCRGVNYKGYPDEFFQEVCDLLGWPR